MCCNRYMWLAPHDTELTFCTYMVVYDNKYITNINRSLKFSENPRTRYPPTIGCLTMLTNTSVSTLFHVSCVVIENTACRFLDAKRGAKDRKVKTILNLIAIVNR